MGKSQSHSSRNRIAALSLGIAILSGSLVAEAKGPAFVGTWGLTKAQCKIAQDDMRAPLILRARSSDQYETHCAFTSVRFVKGVWYISERCSVQGDVQGERIRLWLRKGILYNQASTGKAQWLVRCK